MRKRRQPLKGKKAFRRNSADMHIDLVGVTAEFRGVGEAANRASDAFVRYMVPLLNVAVMSARNRVFGGC